MLQVSSRKAKESDLSIVFQFEQSYIEEIEPDKLARWQAAEVRIKQQLSGNLDRMFIAGYNNRVIGHCFWDVFNGISHICSIFVIKEYRRSGAASRLMQLAEADCIANGFEKCLLRTYETNPAEHLFRKLGYIYLENKDGWIYFKKSLWSGAGEEAIPRILQT